jgi:hypothetical protein
MQLWLIYRRSDFGEKVYLIKLSGADFKNGIVAENNQDF